MKCIDHNQVPVPQEQARTEWQNHITQVTDQPQEVMQHAWHIFKQVYDLNGSVSGVKARALVLVSLLYSSRLLHGSNRTNEEYLLRVLATPFRARHMHALVATRVMNKAFTRTWKWARTRTILFWYSVQPGYESIFRYSPRWLW